MGKNKQKANIIRLGELVKRFSPDLCFTMLEIGALPVEGENEPFHVLPDIFPNSRVIAFEVDEELCNELNQKSNNNIEYFPVAVGRTDGEQTFYETMHPMCCSLYKPNEALLSIYNALEVASLKSTGSVRTICLDSFVHDNHIDSIDFVKIDIQGAELDVFKGGEKALQDVVLIVSEVEFVPLYIDQPLFGDVCNYLADKGMMFHKFLDMSGRTIKPVLIRNNPGIPTQHMWSDAVFIRDIQELNRLSSDSLLKLGVLGYMYGSPDLSYHCFYLYDKREHTSLHEEYSRMGL